MKIQKKITKAYKVARFYSINREKLDEQCQNIMDFIFKIASRDKIADILKQCENYLHNKDEETKPK